MLGRLVTETPVQSVDNSYLGDEVVGGAGVNESDKLLTGHNHRELHSMIRADAGKGVEGNLD
jgi:hypothetical protein